MARSDGAPVLEQTVRYRRVVLKISGEALAGGHGFGIDPDTVNAIAAEVAEATRLKVQMALVVGGGNIWRGNAPAAKGMDRNTADYMGMLGTIINALALQSALEKRDVETRVQTAIEMKAVAEPYIRRRAVRHLEKGRVVIFAGGTGNPYFTTDTTAALRAAEIEADAMLKATQAEGVFDRDPREHPDAVMFEEIPYIDVLKRGLQVMDATATSLCMDNDIPIIVFDLGVSGNVLRVLRGEPVGTLVGDGRRGR